MVDLAIGSTSLGALLLHDAMQFGWKMRFHSTQGHGHHGFAKTLKLDPKHLWGSCNGTLPLKKLIETKVFKYFQWRHYECDQRSTSHFIIHSKQLWVPHNNDVKYKTWNKIK